MKKYCFLFFALVCLGIMLGKAQYANLLNFDGANGAFPQGSLTLVGNKLYGMTLDGGGGVGTIFSIDTNGNNYKDLLNFNGTNGGAPSGDLTFLGSKLYGMTGGGGANNLGCIFSIDTNGNGYEDLFDFYGTEGNAPLGSLTLSGKVLFGMTSLGGAQHVGNIFSIDTDGSTFKDLFDFNGTNGSSPTGNLTLSKNVLYGMTEEGGANSDGCIFSIDTNGSNYKDLFDFNGTNGYRPSGSLTLFGNVLYGMAFGGGLNGDGCIFSIDTNGSNYKDLLDFNGSNGFGSSGSLTLSGSLLFGMTPGGGTMHDSGCIFYIDTNGSNYKQLFNFNGIDGAGPSGDITLSGSVLYGMTGGGGTSGDGVVFKLDTTNIGSSINRLTEVSSQWSVYPNPSTGIFTISISGAQNPDSYRDGPGKIEIYNVLGENVFTEIPVRPGTGGLHFVQNDNLIKLTMQPDGVYLYRVVKEDGSLEGEGKLIIQK
jgi:uncharacterized repeat protein (TIGR03803 family)